MPPSLQGPPGRSSINAAVAEERQRHSEELDAVRAELRSASAPADTVAFNGGGLGTTRADCWGQYDQELANRGEHPLQK